MWMEKPSRILRVVYLVLAERHIADGEVIKAGAARRLKARHGDVCLGVKLLCYAPWSWLPCIDSGSRPKKLPTPIDGSSMRPPSKPMLPTAS